MAILFTFSARPLGASAKRKQEMLMPRLCRDRERLGRNAAGGLYQRLKELQVEGRGRIRFRMPLHTDAEPRGIGGLNRLDDAVGGQCGDTKAGSEELDGLVMVAVDAQ